MANISIIDRTQAEGKADGVYKVKASIDEVTFNNITPKFISSYERLFSDTEEEKTLIQKTPAYIFPGVNAIDIDWNEAVINGTTYTLSYTSDFIKFLSSIYTKVKNREDIELADLWETVKSTTPPQA